MIRLEMRGVVRRFTRGPECVEALRGVDLACESAGIHAIVGASGSGKTTLLNIAGGVDRPTEGTVRLMGEPLDGLSEAARTRLRRRHVGMVFQDFLLVPSLTALENVRLPLAFASGPGRDEDAAALLEKVGCAARAGFRPHQLSGGEQQRVAIARALIRRPAILLADEPTGNLGAAQASQIMDLFEALAASDGITILLATHNDACARRASAAHRLHDGRLAPLS